MYTALALPTQCAFVTAEEMVYLDGGAGRWDDWNPYVMLNSGIRLIGSAAISMAAGLTANAIYEGKDLALVWTPILQGGLAKKAALSVLTLAAVYTAATTFLQTYATIMGLYYSLFPQAAAPAASNEPLPAAA